MMCVVVEWQRNIRISPLYPSALLPVYYRSHRHTHTQFVQKLVAECCRQYTPEFVVNGGGSITAHQTTPHACHHKRGRSSIRYVKKCSRTRRLPPRVYRNVTIVEEGEVREITRLKKQGQMEDCSTAPTVTTLRTLAPTTVA